MTDVERFKRELHGRFDDFPGSEKLRDRRFSEISKPSPG